MQGHFEYTSCVARDFTNIHVTDTRNIQTQDNNLWIASVVEFVPTTLGALESGVATALTSRPTVQTNYR